MPGYPIGNRSVMGLGSPAPRRRVMGIAAPLADPAREGARKVYDGIRANYPDVVRMLGPEGAAEALRQAQEATEAR